MTRLVLVCGLPGAGKTVAASRIARDTGAVLLSPDAWMVRLGLDPHDEPLRDRVEGQLWDLAQVLLRRGQDVILDNGFWSEQERDGYRLTARELGVQVQLVVLEAPFEVLWERVSARNLEAGSDGAGSHGAGTDSAAGVIITREQLESYLPFWQPPTAAELALFDQ